VEDLIVGQVRRTLELLSGLSYRSGELDRYLQEIAVGVSQLIKVDWSVVTLCHEGLETVLASSPDIGCIGKVYSLHGLLTGTVVALGRSLAVEDAIACTDYGQPPDGYHAYLGVPLLLPNGTAIGTICSFHRQPRHFSGGEVRIAELFAERAATAIDNYQLYQQQCQFNHRLEAEVERRTEQLRQAQVKLVEQERLAAIGEFASTIVHEIRNPLTTINLGLNYFKRTDLSEASQVRLALATSELDRLKHLLSEILLYAKPQVLQLTSVDVRELSAEILESIADAPERQQIKFATLDSPTAVLGDRDKLKQVCINLLRNACEASPPEESVRWQIDRTADLICLSWHNGGKPIDPEHLSKLTQPFFTTKPEGTGLGLAIVKRIIDAHGGELAIESGETGTTVTVRLPQLDQ
jgi:signal transduction histidine kinase